MITVATLGGNLKRKYVTKNKLKSQADFFVKEDQFKIKYGRKPITDSEIDEAYGAGSATRALDKVHRKNK